MIDNEVATAGGVAVETAIPRSVSREASHPFPPMIIAVATKLVRNNAALVLKRVQKTSR
jgi:hypothetical protein